LAFEATIGDFIVYKSISAHTVKLVKCWLKRCLTHL
jgi:hypothetical protein